MKPSQVIESIKLAYRMRQPCFVWGSMGLGKSDCIRQAAKELEVKLIDLRAVLLDAVDLRGIPTVSNGLTSWAIPSFLPRDGQGILLLDEINQAPNMVQAALLQLILDRKLGEYVLPADWVCVAAGNREQDKTGVHKLLLSLANRFAYHLQFEFNLDDWCSWANVHELPAEFVAFARFSPQSFEFNPDKITSKAFFTPRTFTVAAKIYQAKPHPDIENELICSCIGEAEGSKLMGFLKIYRDLPNPDLIIQNPTSSDVPTGIDVLYALTTALSQRANVGNFSSVLVYADRLPEEFSVLLVRDAIRQTPRLANTQAFRDWAIKHADVLTAKTN